MDRAGPSPEASAEELHSMIRHLQKGLRTLESGAARGAPSVLPSVPSGGPTPSPTLTNSSNDGEPQDRQSFTNFPAGLL